jgi:DeoR family fructose operon transcriptional repressor
MKIPHNDIVSRRTQILEKLGMNGYTKVEDLASQLSVSLVTIRRDLLYLETQHLVTRFHGGAQVVKNPIIQTVNGRDMKTLMQIAEKAVTYIEDGDTVFLNSGITTCSVLQKINKSVFAVTSNIYAMDLDLSDSPITLILTGGQLPKERDSFVGQFTISIVEMVTATKCFLGVNAISADSGMTSSSLQKIMINNRMIERCNGPKIVVAEGYKIGKTTNFHVCSITKITHLITDVTADPVELEKLRKAGVEVVVV